MIYHMIYIFVVQEISVSGIKSIRVQLGLTQEQFAQKLGVSWATVNRWERHKSNPSPLALQKLRRLVTKLKVTSLGPLD